MSLLMEALRKAEAAKRDTAEPTIGSTVELSLEPLPAATAESQAPPAPNSTTTEPQQQRAVHNVFASKQPPAKRAPVALLLAGVGLLGLIGIGAYVWWQIQPKAPQQTAALPAPPPRPALSAPMPTPPLQVSEAPAVPAVAAPLLSSDEKLVSPRLEPAAAPPAAAGPVRFNQSRPRINPLISQGYEALQKGNLAQAQQAYEQALAQDPKNADTLYGLAAIALQRNQPALAEDYYLRVLDSDPRDAVAHAGLSGLRGKAGGNTESRLKILIAEQPGVAALHFALGNVYAQESRWREAQQAYFLAYKNDAEHPDIAFNLAVSLDQLHQGKVAAQYYAEALRLATQQRSSFNRTQAQQRLAELQPER